MDDSALTKWDAPTKRMQKSWKPGHYGENSICFTSWKHFSAFLLDPYNMWVVFFNLHMYVYIFFIYTHPNNFVIINHQNYQNEQFRLLGGIPES